MLRIQATKNRSHDLKVRLCDRACKRTPPVYPNGVMDIITDTEGSWSVAAEIGLLKFTGRKPLEFTDPRKFAPPYTLSLRKAKRVVDHNKKYPLMPYITDLSDDQYVESSYWGGSHFSEFGISPQRINEFYELAGRLLENRTPGFGFGVQNCGVGRVNILIFIL